MVSTPTGQGGLGLEKLEGIAIPVSLTGTLDQPKWRVDPTMLLVASQRGRLGEQATQLLQALGGNGKDKTEDKTDLGSDLLKALLNEAAKREQKKATAKPDSR